jgi:hypothetical protein
VDGHEKEETKLYRKDFIKRYLHHEIRMHRWVQLEVRQMELMTSAGPDGILFNMPVGHRYADATTNTPMIEYHVDDHPHLQKMMNESTLFGGNLSVRKPADAKPLVSFGQDEAIFKQYSFTPKAWTSPDGEKPIIPKDEGLGVMISAFVSREFGFGMALSPAQLLAVNLKRRGKKYMDEAAAKAKKGSEFKKDLLDSPFVVEFEYRVNGSGYWQYEWMMCQLEDCLDVVTVLYRQYDYLFLFDHSCGHDRKRPDGLCSNSLSKGYGGAQPTMRPSPIVSLAFLGPFAAQVGVGDEQHMSFQDG